MFREELRSAYAPYAVLSDEQLGSLERHYKLLTHWNQSLNLTRIRGLDETVRLHYCESLFVAHVLPPGSLKIADVGSGAGFPGIPFAIMRPECTIDLIESHQRKAVFLRQASRELTNVRVIAERAGSSVNQAVNEYDWVIARAVSPHEVLALACAPRAAVLMSAADLQGLPEPLSVFPIPWGNQRVLALFHVELARGV